MNTSKETKRMGYTGYLNDMPVLYITAAGMDRLKRVIAESVTPKLWELKEQDSDIFGWFKNNAESPIANKMKIRREVEKLKAEFNIKETIIDFVFSDATTAIVRLKPNACKDILTLVESYDDSYCYGDPDDMPTMIDDIKGCFKDAVEEKSILKFEQI